MSRKSALLLFLAVCFLFGLMSCRLSDATEMKKLKNPLVGSWLSYRPDGEFGPSIELYDFYDTQEFRIIIAVPPNDGKADTLPTGFAMFGEFSIKGNKLSLRSTDGNVKTYEFEIQDGILFIQDSNERVFFLRRVMDK